MQESQQSPFNGREFDPSGAIKGAYIVTFKNQFENAINEQAANQADQLREEILSAHQIRQDSVLNRYTYAIKGFAAKLNAKQVEALKNDPRILRITPNKLMSLGIVSSSGRARTTSNSATMQTGQTVPWGISRVNGPFDGAYKKAWIIDTGIDLDHSDLNVDTGNSISYIPGQGPDDIHGHGTHVAGIIAAKDNGTDIVGVASGATVVAVKVCYEEAPSPTESQCPLNSILDGIDYVSNNAQNNDIVNMSLWARNVGIVPDWDDAVSNAATSGIRFTLIAGNYGVDANNYSPGRTGQHSNIWTISSFDNNDTFAFDSNFGNPPIDFGGPGVDVLSLEIGGGTISMSGTSQAAPHLAGILLIQGTNTTSDPGDYPVPTDGTVTNDPDNDPDEIAVASDLSVYVSRPSFVTYGHQGTWTPSVSGGNSPYNYEWFRNVNNPPYWQPVGTGSSYSETVTESFELKVRVTDDNQTIVTSNARTIYVN